MYPADGVLKVPNRSGQHLQLFSEAVRKLFADDMSPELLSQNFKVFIQNDQRYAGTLQNSQNFLFGHRRPNLSL